MRRVRKLLATAAAAAVLALGAGPAFAQVDGPLAGATQDPFSRDRNVSVRERPKPELDAIGVPVGALRLYPEVEVGVSHTDNVLGSSTNEQEETSLVSRAAARLTSQFPRHAASLTAETINRNGFDSGVEDGALYTLAADGRFDVRRGTYLTARAAIRQELETRTDLAPRFAIAEPVEVEIREAAVGAMSTFNRLRVVAEARVADLDYDGPPLQSGVGVWSQEERNRSVFDVDARAEYAVAPPLAGFVSAGYRSQDYNLERPRAPLDRDSDGWTVLVGANFDLTRLARGEIGVGYQSVEYGDPTLDTTDGVSAAARVEWFPSTLVTVTADAERAVIESEEALASGIMRTAFGLRADWEPRRNVILGAGFRYADDEYEGLDRADSRWRAEVSAEYMLNRVVAVTGTFARLEQESDGVFRGESYEANRFTLALRVRR